MITVFYNHKLVHNQSLVINRQCPFLLNLHRWKIDGLFDSIIRRKWKLWFCVLSYFSILVLYEISGIDYFSGELIWFTLFVGDYHTIIFFVCTAFPDILQNISSWGIILFISFPVCTSIATIRSRRLFRLGIWPNIIVICWFQ